MPDVRVVCLSQQTAHLHVLFAVAHHIHIYLAVDHPPDRLGRAEVYSGSTPVVVGIRGVELYAALEVHEGLVVAFVLECEGSELHVQGSRVGECLESAAVYLLGLAVVSAVGVAVSPYLIEPVVDRHVA